MKRCEVHTPFHMVATDTVHVPGDIIEVSDAQLARFKSLNIKVTVLGETEEAIVEEAEPKAEEAPKKRKPRKPKQEQ